MWAPVAAQEPPVQTEESRCCWQRSRDCCRLGLTTELPAREAGDVEIQTELPGEDEIVSELLAFQFATC